MKKTRFGFTLLELMISIGVIGLLVTMGSMSYSQVTKKSRVTKSLADLREINIGISRLAIDTGLIPGEGPLDPCVQNPEIVLDTCQSGLFSRCTTSDFAGWKGPYLSDPLLNDHWGSSYIFDPDYLCRADVAGCEKVNYTSSDSIGQLKFVRAIFSTGPDKLDNYCTNPSGCTRRDSDNVVMVLCGQ